MIDLDINNGHVTGVIQNKSVNDVLKIINKSVGFKLVLMGDFQTKISLSFKDEQIHKAIKRISENYSLAILYKPSMDASNQNNKLIISEVWLFETHKVLPPDDSGRDQPKVTEISEPDNSFILNNTSMEIHQNNYESNSGTETAHWNNVLRQNQDINMQKLAISELRWIGSNEALSAMAKVLGYNNIELRSFAVNNIGSIDTDFSTQLLGQVLLSDKSDEVRLIAVHQLANKDSDISKIFLKKALDDKDQKIREFVKELLELNVSIP